jgi:hypothetical protein
MALLEHEALLVGEANVGGSVPADPKDEMFLACAMDGQADLIVSGNLPTSTRIAPARPQSARGTICPVLRRRQSQPKGDGLLQTQPASSLPECFKSALSQVCQQT